MSVSVRLVVPVTVPLQLEVVAPVAPVDPETLVPLVPADDDVLATPPNRGHALSEL